MKVSGRKYIFLVLYVDDIFLTANDIDLLVETKQILFSHITRVLTHDKCIKYVVKCLFFASILLSSDKMYLSTNIDP